MTRLVSVENTTWPTVRLGDVVNHKQDVERESEAAGFERYLKVEHFDAGRLHISRWGEIENGDLPPTFYKVFRRGQVLFPTRNPHLRRVAFAEFDGICGEKTLTLEANEQISPQLLPFVFQSEQFWQFAQTMAIGSTNPHVRWRDIAAYKFPLPSIDEQVQIAEILWAAEDSVQQYENVVSKLLSLRDAVATEFLTHEWPVVKLGEVLENVQYGSSSRASNDSSKGVPILGIPNVVGGRLNHEGCRFIELSDQDRAKYQLRDGDVLIVRTNGNPEYVGRTALVESAPSDAVYASYLIRLRTDHNRLLPGYLQCALSSSLLRRTLRHEIRSSAGNYNLNTKGIKRQKLPLAPVPEQVRFVNEIADIDLRLDEVRSHMDRLQIMQKTLINAHTRGKL